MIAIINIIRLGLVNNISNFSRFVVLLQRSFKIIFLIILFFVTCLLTLLLNLSTYTDMLRLKIVFAFLFFYLGSIILQTFATS